MYYLKKKLTIAGAHHLCPPYKGKCNNLHGHNWIITVYCCSPTLNACGMIVDFSEIKRIVNELDHENLNKHLPQPTAENIARYLCKHIPLCTQVDVEESEGAVATYVED